MEYEVRPDMRVDVLPSDLKQYRIVNLEDGTTVVMTGAKARAYYGPADWRLIKSGGVPYLEVTAVVPPHAPYRRLIKRFGGGVIGDTYRLLLADQTVTVGYNPADPAGRYHLYLHSASEFGAPVLIGFSKANSLAVIAKAIKDTAAGRGMCPPCP